MGLVSSARGGRALCALAAATFALLVLAGPAGADISLCPPGEGAGQCGASQAVSVLRGLAVDTATGRLYVADEVNNRVDVFEEDGDFLFAFGWGVDTGAAQLETCTTASGCQKGSAGSGAGQFNGPTGVAVDNDPASGSHHDVYVADRGDSEKNEGPRVQKFDPAGEFVWAIGKEVNHTTNADLCTKASGDVCGKAAYSQAAGGFKSDIASAVFVDVGPGGVLDVVDSLRPVPTGNLIEQRLQRFDEGGAPIGSPAILTEGDLNFARGMAVDSAGNLWVGSQEEGLRKYSPTGAPLAGPIADTDFPHALAIDEATGDLYLSLREGPFSAIALYDPSGAIQRRFAYAPSSGGSYIGLAVHASAFGEVFFSVKEAGIEYVFLPPPGPIVPAASVKAIEIRAARATLFAEVNPEGKETTVHFEYVEEATYLKDIGELGAGHGFDHAKETEEEKLGTEDFKLKPFEALAGCANPAGEAGEPGKCLTPATKYRFRVIATNADGEGEGTAEGAFTTNEAPEQGNIWASEVGTDTARLNGEVNPNELPTTGYFEYVDDATYREDVEELGEGHGFDDATKAPNVDEGQAPLDFGAGEEFLARGATIYPLAPGTTYHYRLVAENPLSGAIEGKARELRTFEAARPEPPCANDASRIGFGALLPDCRAYEMVSPLDKEGGDIRLLKTSLGGLAVLEQASLSGEKLAYGSARSFAGDASAPFTSQYIARRIPGAEWRTHPIDSPRGKPIFGALGQFDTEFKAFSADLCEAWKTTFAEPPLAEGALTGLSNLYRRTDELCSEDGAAHYETLAPITTPSGVASGSDFVMKPMGASAEGTHAIFTADGKLAAGANSKGATQLYESVRGATPRLVCILPNGTPQSGSCTAGSGEETTINNPGSSLAGRISEDGERIFWSASATDEDKLYVRIGGAKTLAVSQAAEAAQGTSASWFWGAAADGSKAIFSTGGLSGGTAALYEFDVDGKATTPIAEGVFGVMGISDDAERVYFASSKALTGEEANSNGEVAQAGEPNLYLHEAGGGTEFIGTLAATTAEKETTIGNERFGKHTSRVTPDGAHAAFLSVAPLSGYDNTEAGTSCGNSNSSGDLCQEVYRYDAGSNQLLCVSCNPSGARPAGRSGIPAWESGLHAARVLSDDGARLYFESADALAARDTNGRVDVYQWEEAGGGGCGEEDPGFSAAAQGCVELVSSGQNPQDSRFVEASPSGGDVFFATAAGLLPQDFGVFDIYDARVDGGLPIPPLPRPPCEGDASAPQVAAPEEETPASSTYVPPAVKKASRCPKGKRRVIRKGKSRCVAKHRHKGRRAR